MSNRLFVTLLIIIIIVGLLLFAASTARTYTGLNTGFGWDWGGVELTPDTGVFLCRGNYSVETGTFTPNPLAALLPELVADC